MSGLLEGDAWSATADESQSGVSCGDVNGQHEYVDDEIGNGDDEMRNVRNG